VPVAAATKVLTTASYAEPEPEPEPFRAVVTGAELSNNAEPTLKRDKKRTPEENRKNFAATIVGLLPGQAHIIKNDFKFAKLSFVHADARNSGQLVALSKSHNPVVFMTFARKIERTLPAAPKAGRPFGAIEESFVCLAIRLPVSSGSEWVVQTIRLHTSLLSILQCRNRPQSA
jgi:hypothetical protein